MLKLIQSKKEDSDHKFKCPYCTNKGKSVRASKPKFKTIYEESGNSVLVFRTSLMQCKNCYEYYASQEKQSAENWVFESYHDSTVYLAMEEDYTAPVYLGSTASEWSKRQASGGFIKTNLK